MTVFFSDIHANLPALEAFFEELDRLKPDAVYCLGDLVGYHIWPNEVIEQIRQRRIPVIMGNHDEAQLKPIAADDMSNKGITSRMLSEDNKTYLHGLPKHIRLDFGQKSMLLVHGSPRKINEYLYQSHEESDLLDFFESNQVDIILCGHTHLPYIRQIKTSSGLKTIINTGSVGRPKDGDYRGSYVFMDRNFQFSVHRFDYDLEKSVNALAESDFDPAYITVLRQGKSR